MVPSSSPGSASDSKMLSGSILWLDFEACIGLAMHSCRPGGCRPSLFLVFWPPMTAKGQRTLAVDVLYVRSVQQSDRKRLKSVCFATGPDSPLRQKATDAVLMTARSDDLGHGQQLRVLVGRQAGAVEGGHLPPALRRGAIRHGSLSRPGNPVICWRPAQTSTTA